MLVSSPSFFFQRPPLPLSRFISLPHPSRLTPKYWTSDTLRLLVEHTKFLESVFPLTLFPPFPSLMTFSDSLVFLILSPSARLFFLLLIRNEKREFLDQCVEDLYFFTPMRLHRVLATFLVTPFPCRDLIHKQLRSVSYLFYLSPSYILSQPDHLG